MSSEQILGTLSSWISPQSIDSDNLSSRQTQGFMISIASTSVLEVCFSLLW